MQGLVVVGLVVEKLSNVVVKCVKVTAVWNIGQVHQVNISAKSVHREEALCNVWWYWTSIKNVSKSLQRCIYNVGQGQWVKSPAVSTLTSSEKHYARFGCSRPYIWGDIEHQHKMCQSHLMRRWVCAGLSVPILTVYIVFDDNIGIIFSIKLLWVLIRSASIEYPQHTFLWSNKKSYPRIIALYGLVVVGLKVEEISNIDVKCASPWSTKYRPRSPDQGTCKVRTLRRSTMQGLVVVGLIVEVISNVNIKRVKVTAALYIQCRSRSMGQKSCCQYTEEKHYARFGCCRPYIWGDIERQHKMCQSHLMRRWVCAGLSVPVLTVYIVFDDNIGIIFSIKMLWVLIRSASIEYPQHTFLWSNKKSYSRIIACLGGSVGCKI